MHPEFLPGCRGRLHAVHYAPAAGVPERGGVLCLPPFAEEMNKSRRMLALTARRLAAAGWGVLLVDAYGSGDSEGEFVDARWDDWLDDYAACADLLRTRHPGRLVLWGVRTGALLAIELGTARAVTADAVLLWQPVTGGELALTQFLRLRIAAAMMAGTRETAGSLRERLAAGESLEIAGYELHPELAAALDARRLQAPADGVPLVWLELVAEPDRPPAAVGQRLIAAWRERGTRVECASMAGEAFWATQEITVVPALVEATVDGLDGLYEPRRTDTADGERP